MTFFAVGFFVLVILTAYLLYDRWFGKNNLADIDYLRQKNKELSEQINKYVKIYRDLDNKRREAHEKGDTVITADDLDKALREGL